MVQWCAQFPSAPPTAIFRLKVAAGSWLTRCRGQPMQRLGQWQSENACGIVVIHPLEDLVGQTDAIDLPSALRRSRRGRIVEVLVKRFEESEIATEHLGFQILLWHGRSIWRCVSAEHDAVRVLFKELARPSGLAAELAEPGTYLHVQVGVLVEPR